MANDATGYIGLKPSDEQSQEFNFMFNLKKNGHIDHQVFALFMDLNDGFHTHLKMGGYDSNTLAEGDKLHFVRTIEKSSWSMESNSITLND
jgi:hypothetical protein